MACYVESFTTNWFTVTDMAGLRAAVNRIDCDPRQDSGQALTIHERDGAVRLTMYDCLDTMFDFYDEESDEEWELSAELVKLLAEGEVLRITSVSWYKSEIARFMYEVFTADGRTYKMTTMEAEDAAVQTLGIDRALLYGL